MNLVVNDLNAVNDIRNTVGTIKDIISFFRDSVLRRKLVPNLPLLSETRWTAKYKSIRQFSDNSVAIVEALEKLSAESNNKTRQRAHQLLCAATTTSFIVCLQIISKYSAQLEPVANILQGISIDQYAVHGHVSSLINIFKGHRNNADSEFHNLMTKVKEVAEQIGVEIKVPRTTSKQVYRANHSSVNPEDYYRQSLFIPYLDSLISSLSDRFSDTNKSSFSLFQLHPANMKKLSAMKFSAIASNIQEMYGIDNFEAEAKSWFEIWKAKTNADLNIPYFDLLQETKFFPAIRTAIIIGLTLPATTCTVERTFSTLRRVKTWLRSTMCEDRLSGLCMLSLHRNKVNANLNKFLDDVINKFASAGPRRLQLLFHD